MKTSVQKTPYFTKKQAKAYIDRLVKDEAYVTPAYIKRQDDESLRWLLNVVQGRKEADAAKWQKVAETSPMMAQAVEACARVAQNKCYPRQERLIRAELARRAKIKKRLSNLRPLHRAAAADGHTRRPTAGKTGQQIAVPVL